MSGPVSLEVMDGIAVVTIDNPPVNACSQAVRAGLVEAAGRIAADGAIVGAVLRCAGRTFVAGADITEFGKPPMHPTLSEAFDAIEALGKPVCAVMHGTTLGGGLELALACHLRLIDPDGAVGLPEVTLGIIPGAGGTQRLPRLIGAEPALGMITTGRRVAAAEALSLGIVDAVTTGDRLAFARGYLRERLAPPVRRLSALPFPPVDPAWAATQQVELARRMPGQIAPGAAITVATRSVGRSFADGMACEADAFGALRVSPQSIAMRHIFFAERAVGKVPELDTAKPGPLTRVGVVGGGIMGAGIATALLLAGVPAVLLERDATALAGGVARIGSILADSVKRGKITAMKRDTLLADMLHPATEPSAMAQADLVIEAVFEDMAVKRDVFATLGQVMRPDAVLATNTSYLDVAALAQAAPHPARVIGLHFFSPAHVMKLMEVVVPTGASAQAVATGFALARRLGKIAVRTGNAEGFIGNRILSAYRKAADYCVLDGASPADVDDAMVAFGFPMGVFAMQDMAGLEIGWATRKRLAATRDPRERVSHVADRICEAGHFGRKTGRGFYRYDAGAPVPDPEVLAIVTEERRAAGIVPRTFTPAEIARRILLAAVNEGAHILEQSIALRAGDIDVVMVNGYGFPRTRGGPMHAADALGLPAVLDALRELEVEDAWFWRPAPLLIRLAEARASFAAPGPS